MNNTPDNNLEISSLIFHEDFKGLKTVTQKTTITPTNRTLFSKPFFNRNLPDSQISHLQIAPARTEPPAREGLRR